MKPIIKKVINLTKANGGEVKFKDIPLKTRIAFMNELKRAFGKEFVKYSKQINKFRVV